MSLTNAQHFVILKADILADAALAALPNTANDAETIASVYAMDAVPDWWVSRTRVTEEEIFEVTTPAPDNTTWSWPAYITRSQAERDGWGRMFGRRGYINPSLANIKQGLADIFSGAGGLAQRTHVLAICRRKATRIEKLLSTGTGTAAAPATMGFEGTLTVNDVIGARQPA